MKYIFIVNPHAGAEDNEQKIIEQIAALPNSEECEVYTTKAVGDATDFITNYLNENPARKVRFIACGGDGTVNEVFNGAVGHDNASVSCYPCGSGNDFVKVFGGAEKFMNIASLVSAPEKKIDLLKVGERYSNNVVNFGFDTTVAITINKQREKTGHGGKSAYTKGIITALLKSMKNKCKVRADGEIINPDGRMLLCTVANGQYVGGSFKCAPRAKIDDGLIEVCLIKPISRLRFVKILGTYTEGKHLDDESMQDIVIYRQAKKVDVVAPEGFAYSLDGEIVYENKFTIEIVKDAVNFACPE